MSTGVVLLTGATGKIGMVLMRHLCSNHWHVVAVTRDRKRALQKFDEVLRGVPENLDIVESDLLAENALEELALQLHDLEISVTHLVNNARSRDSLVLQEDGTASREKFHEEFDLNVVQPYRLVMMLAGSEEHDLQVVVNIGSMYGLVAPTPALYEGSLTRSPVQYGVSKAALHHLTRELAVRLAPRVRVNCVAFGGVAGRADAQFMERYAALCPIGRMLDEQEVAGPVEFLLSEASSSVNGHVLVCDGGWSIW